MKVRILKFKQEQKLTKYEGPDLNSQANEGLRPNINKI